MVYCYVCNQEINHLGWPNHVAMEKRKHGKNIYQMLKAEREGRLKKIKGLKKHPYNRKLDDY